MPVGPHAGGDHHGFGDDLAVFADVDVGCVKPDVREGLMIKPAAAQDRDVIIDAFADPADGGLADSRVTPECFDQVIDFAGGGAGDVGPHDHRPQRLVDASAWLQQLGKEAALPQLGDAHLDITRRGRHQFGSVTVALGETKRVSFGRFSADLGSQFGLNQLLQCDLDDLADRGGQGGVRAADALSKLRQGRLITGHRVEPLFVRDLRFARWPTYHDGPAPTPRGGTHPRASQSTFELVVTGPQRRGRV